jgi:phosphopantetheine--protein transferase-like protein
MPVGNDIVDLDDPAIARAHERERFVARVCTPAERARLAASPPPARKRLLWTLFAAKEAAYKIAAKLGPAPGFAHKRFEVAPDLRTVRDVSTDTTMHLTIEADDAAGFVHAIATTDAPEGVRHGVKMAPAGADLGKLVREASCRSLAELLGCESDELSIKRATAPGSWDGFAPPTVHRGSQPTNVDVSLSHDGRFAAFAGTLSTHSSS